MERQTESGTAELKEKKGGWERKAGKQVQLLILVIMFLPGQRISKTCCDVK